MLIVILDNAIKFSPENESVDIILSQSETITSVLIKDRGCGIDSNDLPYIFDRYFKTSQNLKTGTGIGLSLVKEIVTGLMNGSIVVKSEVGKGSTFTVELNNIQTIF